jgi:hypothetical protein
VQIFSIREKYGSPDPSEIRALEFKGNAVIAIQLCCYSLAVVGIIAILSIAFGS